MTSAPLRLPTQDPFRAKGEDPRMTPPPDHDTQRFPDPLEFARQDNAIATREHALSVRRAIRRRHLGTLPTQHLELLDAIDRFVTERPAPPNP